MKKLFSILLIFLLLLGFAACGPKENTPSKSSGAKSKSSSSKTYSGEESNSGENSFSDTQGSAEENSKGSSVSSKKTGTKKNSNNTVSTITLDKYTPKIKKLRVQTDGRTVNADNTIAKYLKDKLGFEIELIYISQAQLRSQLSLMASSNNLPDVFSIYSGETIYTTLRDGDMLADLEPLLKTCAPDILSARTWDQLNTLRDDDGVLRAISANMEAPFDMLLIREDWLKKLNLSVPKNIEDFKAVMKAFVERDPDGNNKKDTEGFSTPNGFQGLGGFFPAFNAVPSLWRLDSAGKVVFGSVQPQPMKDALKWLRNLREEGLFSDNWSLARDPFNKLVSDGKVGLVHDQLWYISSENYIYTNDSSAKWIALPPPVGPSGKSGYINWLDPNCRKRTCIAKNSADPIAAMLYLNLLADYDVASAIRNGFEGVHWKYSTSSPTGVEALEPYKSDSTLLIGDGVTSTYALPFLLEDPIRAFCEKICIDALATRRKNESSCAAVLYETPDNVIARNDIDLSFDLYAQKIMLKLINEGGSIDSEYQNCIDALYNNYKLAEITKLYQETYDKKKKAGTIK